MKRRKICRLSPLADDNNFGPIFKGLDRFNNVFIAKARGDVAHACLQQSSLCFIEDDPPALVRELRLLSIEFGKLLQKRRAGSQTNTTTEVYRHARCISAPQNMHQFNGHLTARGNPCSMIAYALRVD